MKERLIMKYQIDESLRVISTGEYLDTGFILDTANEKIYWIDSDSCTREYTLSEVVYSDSDNTPVSLEDGELNGTEVD
jgi:hypothetical protein